ncbi:MAG: hypothetical protein M1470_03535 [Bacteroidetes bacterium]|nr:hypothetical protein [Bacteroidota bacterium]MCL5738859.1 hypothetical protein [Bacteroidota bacterium]
MNRNVEMPQSGMESPWSHIAVLRVLQDSQQGLTGRKIARLSGMNHRACLNALTELELLSVIRCQREGKTTSSL